MTVLELAALVSPPPTTLAVFALAPVVVGLTVRVIVAVPLLTMAVLLVQLTTCPAAEQVKPPPLPLTKLKPAGSVSATVTVPLVAAVPVLVTTRV